mmetsp:Transcript_75405/g.245272  ORF Transcript_75405/g.245272 Transcript_75405/m.245272 type:complete len:201 (-) Transcript_75405:498-1100(-)
MCLGARRPARQSGGHQDHPGREALRREREDRGRHLEGHPSGRPEGNLRLFDHVRQLHARAALLHGAGASGRVPLRLPQEQLLPRLLDAGPAVLLEAVHGGVGLPARRSAPHAHGPETREHLATVRGPALALALPAAGGVVPAAESVLGRVGGPRPLHAPGQQQDQAHRFRERHVRGRAPLVDHQHEAVPRARGLAGHELG